MIQKIFLLLLIFSCSHQEKWPEHRKFDHSLSSVVELYLGPKDISNRGLIGSGVAINSRMIVSSARNLPFKHFVPGHSLWVKDKGGKWYKGSKLRSISGLTGVYTFSLNEAVSSYSPVRSNTLPIGPTLYGYNGNDHKKIFKITKNSKDKAVLLSLEEGHFNTETFKGEGIPLFNREGVLVGFTQGHENAEFISKNELADKKSLSLIFSQELEFFGHHQVVQGEIKSKLPITLEKFLFISARSFLSSVSRSYDKSKNVSFNPQKSIEVKKAHEIMKSQKVPWVFFKGGNENIKAPQGRVYKLKNGGRMVLSGGLESAAFSIERSLNSRPFSKRVGGAVGAGRVFQKLVRYKYEGETVHWQSAAKVKEWRDRPGREWQTAAWLSNRGELSLQVHCLETPRGESCLSLISGLEGLSLQELLFRKTAHTFFPVMSGSSVQWKSFLARRSGKEQGIWPDINIRRVRLLGHESEVGVLPHRLSYLRAPGPREASRPLAFSVDYKKADRSSFLFFQKQFRLPASLPLSFAFQAKVIKGKRFWRNTQKDAGKSKHPK